MQGWCSACPHWAWNTIFVHTFQSEQTLKSFKSTLDLRRRFLSVFGPVSHQQVISVAWLFQSLRTIYNSQPAIQVKPQSPLPGTRKNWGELTSDTDFVTRAFLTSRACPQILTISKNFGWFGKIYISDNVIWKKYVESCWNWPKWVQILTSNIFLFYMIGFTFFDRLMLGMKRKSPQMHLQHTFSAEADLMVMNHHWWWWSNTCRTGIMHEIIVLEIEFGFGWLYLVD